MAEPTPDTEPRERKPPRWLEAALALPHATLGWLNDTGRLYWGFLELNLRKTLFRRGRGRVRCPCQNPSDSGRAFETSCDAVTPWSKPERFRRLCPLLRKAPDGRWMCSVDTAAVRPFWGRAFATAARTAAVAYLCATLLAFLLFRVVGYPVAYRAVAWPPAWHEIGKARAQFFLKKAARDFRDNKPGPAMMALSQGYELDPENYDAGLTLARLSQSAWGDLSNRVYQRLLHDHPEKAAQTAAFWYAALLVRGDFQTISLLAADRVNEGPAWLNALLFASRRTGDRESLRRLIQSKRELPAYVRPICTLELQLRAADAAGARRILGQQLSPTPAPFLAYYWINRQVRAGLPDAALLTMRRVGRRLESRDRVELVLDIYAAQGWQSVVEGEVDRLLSAGTSAALVELVCAHLVRYPDRVILARMFDAVYRNPLPPQDDRLGAYASLFCAAGTEGDWVRLQAAAAQLKAITGTQFTALDSAESYFRSGPQARVQISRCLRSLPGLPVDVTYALYERDDRMNAGRPLRRP